MTLPRWTLAVVALSCVALGVSIGTAIMGRAGDAVAEAAWGYQDFLREQRAFEARRDLEALKALRDLRSDDLESNLEDQLQGHLHALSNDLERSDVVADVVREIETYRELHPWTPTLPRDPRSTAVLFASARVVPAYESGAMIGVQVSHILPGSAWAEMGLRERDVVVEIDGLAISSPRATLDGLAALQGQVQFEAVRVDEQRVRLRRRAP